MLIRSIFLLLVLTSTISSNTLYKTLNKYKTKVNDKVTEKIQEKCKCELNKSLKSIINYKQCFMSCVFIFISLSS